MNSTIKPRKSLFFAYLTPGVVLYLLVVFVPVFGAFYYSLFNWSGGPKMTFIGLSNYGTLISDKTFWTSFTNNLSLTLICIVGQIGFAFILALMLNYCVNRRFGKLVQTVTYMPYFISVMVLVGMMNIFFSTNYGVVNTVLQAFGFEPFSFMSSEKSFRHMYVWSGIWQGMGYSSVIYFAALSGIDPTLYEAAELDGASKLQRIRYIDLPSIMPTVIIMLIMSAGNLMSIGFEKAYLMQNDRNSGVSEIIATYVYKVGLIDARYSFSAAINLFNSAINFVILIVINKVSRKLSDTSLW